MTRIDALEKVAEMAKEAQGFILSAPVCFYHEIFLEECEECREAVAGKRLEDAIFDLSQLPKPSASPVERPQAVGVWCQPIEGLLYDLDLMPEQIPEGKGRDWNLMLVLKEMHAHFEKFEAYATTLEQRLEGSHGKRD